MSQATAATTASASGTSLLPDGIGLLTTGHLVIAAVFALAAIAVILWGMRLKRARKAGERQIEEHNRELAAGEPTPVTERSPATPTPAAPTPAAPTPAAPPPTAPTMSPPQLQPDVVPLGVAPMPVDTGPAQGPVTLLKGLGPKVAQRLAELGITTVGQVAALTDDDAAALDAQLGAFSGRMGRDRWLEQARFLAAGDKAGFEAVFGRLS